VFMPLPFKEPSQTLFAMYQQLESRGQGFANSTKGVVNDSTNYGKVGTTLALLDASSKLTTSIIRTFHRSRRKELGIIERLIKENMGSYPYAIDGIEDLQAAFDNDFKNELIKVVPISDPNVPNRADRLALAQQRITLCQQFPQVHDARAALYHVYKTLGDENPDRILPSPEQVKPQDPMSDIVSATQGKAISAFKGQAHEAYIAVFNSWMMMPSVQQNETFMPAINAVTAASRQHAVMAFQEKLEALTGGSEQPQQQQQGVEVTGAGTDPRTIAMLQAQAAQQLLTMEQQQQALAANAQDPAMLLVKVQDKKADIEVKKIDSKEKIEFARLANEKAELDLEKEKLAITSMMADNKITADLIKHGERLSFDAAKAKRDSSDAYTSRALDLLRDAAEQDISKRQIKANVDRKSNKRD